MRGQRFALDLVAVPPCIQRFDIARDQRQIIGQRRTRDREALALALHDRGDFGINELLGEAGREEQGVRPAMLGQEPRLGGLQPRAAHLQFAFCGGGQRAIEADDRLALNDGIAFMHEDLGDNSALQMLDHLILAGGDETALCHHRCGQRRLKRPDAEAAKGEGHQGKADECMAPDIARHVGIPFCGIGGDHMRVPLNVSFMGLCGAIGRPHLFQGHGHRCRSPARRFAPPAAPARHRGCRTGRYRHWRAA